MAFKEHEDADESAAHETAAREEDAAEATAAAAAAAVWHHAHLAECEGEPMGNQHGAYKKI